MKVEVQSFRGCFSATIPWSPPDAQAVRVYGPIVNDGDAAIRLVGASSSAAGAVRLERGEPGSFDSVAEVKVPPGEGRVCHGRLASSSPADRRRRAARGGPALPADAAFRLERSHGGHRDRRVGIWPLMSSPTL